MTRFARAKGSKASNEKAPEEGTPWEVMKQQLIQSKKETEESKLRQEAEKQRMENYQSFLNEQKTQKRKATWCEFPETASKTVNQPAKKKMNKNKLNLTADDLNSKSTDKIIENRSETKQKIKKNKNRKELTHIADQLNSISTENIIENSSEIKQKKKKNKNKKELTHIEDKLQKNSAENIIANTSKIKKKKKKNKNKTMTDSLQDRGPSNSDEQNESKELNKMKKHNQTKGDMESNVNNFCDIEDNKINTSKGKEISKKPTKSQKKNKKLFDGKPVRRKEINDNSFQLIINGKEVELIRYDGFPIMKKDAERLEELKNNMIKKGIPKSEVQRTMKLERRRAEKAFARLRREVCYNCRKGGHNLSDCPDLKSKIPGVYTADGVCFKCGSTEHRQFECKVQKNMDFKFATCFFCKQAGHIARQCPDNPKGLYPNGGSCKLCGDVTHLRKDCPSTNTKKEGTTIKLDTFDSDNIEDIAQQTAVSTVNEGTKKPKKIKF